MKMLKFRYIKSSEQTRPEFELDYVSNFACIYERISICNGHSSPADLYFSTRRRFTIALF